MRQTRYLFLTSVLVCLLGYTQVSAVTTQLTSKNTNKELTYEVHPALRLSQVDQSAALDAAKQVGEAAVIVGEAAKFFQSEGASAISKMAKLAGSFGKVAEMLGVFGAFSGLLNGLIFGDPVEKKLDEILDSVKTLGAKIEAQFDDTQNQIDGMSCFGKLNTIESEIETYWKSLEALSVKNAMFNIEVEREKTLKKLSAHQYQIEISLNFILKALSSPRTTVD